jgi:AbrB family looped-hinge helix DNA binding protein
MVEEKVKVTRKYQVTIPQSVRSKLGIKIGDKLIVRSEARRIIMEIPEYVSNPSEVLWNLFNEPLDFDAVKLVEESLVKTGPPELLELSKKGREARAR